MDDGSGDGVGWTSPPVLFAVIIVVIFGVLLLLRDRAQYQKNVEKADALAMHRTASRDEGSAYQPSSIVGGPSKDWMKRIRTQYDLTAHGFLPARALRPLTDPRFAAWEALAKALPTHAAAGTFDAAIGRLPLLDARVLTEDEDLRRAYLVLGHFVHAYIYADDVPWGVAAGGTGAPRRDQTEDRVTPFTLPKQLAVPWHFLCTTLGLPHILTSAGVDLWNWTSPDGQPSIEPSNMTLVTTMTGTASEIGFHMIPCAMQARAGQRDLFPRIFHVPLSIASASSAIIYSKDIKPTPNHNRTAVARADARSNLEAVARADAELLALFTELTAVLVDFKAIFHKVKDLVGVEEFYDIYRPLLGAFWPDGMWLEGCSGNDDGDGDGDGSSGGGGGGGGGGSGSGSGSSAARLLVKAKGPSAGQSTMFIIFDKFLGVHHGNQTSAGQFQDEMLTYMPPKHAQFARDFVALMKETPHASPREYVVLRKDENKGLQQAYDGCVEALKAVRMFHLGVATKYLVRTKYGTGTSTFRDMLKEALDHTTTAGKEVRSGCAWSGQAVRKPSSAQSSGAKKEKKKDM